MPEERTTPLEPSALLAELPADPLLPACIVVIHGEELGRRVPLEDSRTTLGRSLSCQLRLDHQSVSRRHCEIAHRNGGYVVRDLGSTNGTLLNDQPVDESTLADGDRIQVGSTVLKFLAGRNVESRYHEVIYNLMTLDPLTGLHNRRYFEEVLEREIARVHRHHRPCSMLLLDVDHFKRVNDRLGHLGGDAVLRQVADLLRGRLRGDDLVARFGGDELAALLPEVPLPGAHQLAEEIRHTIGNRELHHEDKSIWVTVSIGIAELDGGVKTPDELTRRADGRLYEAKRSGRNRVCG